MMKLTLPQQLYIRFIEVVYNWLVSHQYTPFVIAHFSESNPLKQELASFIDQYGKIIFDISDSAVWDLTFSDSHLQFQSLLKGQSYLVAIQNSELLGIYAKEANYGFSQQMFDNLQSGKPVTSFLQLQDNEDIKFEIYDKKQFFDEFFKLEKINPQMEINFPNEEISNDKTEYADIEKNPNDGERALRAKTQKVVFEFTRVNNKTDSS